jgi:hypothetical protein
MASTTPFFQAFGPLLFGRPARSAVAKLNGSVHSLADLYDLFGHLFNEKLLWSARPPESTAASAFSAPKSPSGRLSPRS